MKDPHREAEEAQRLVRLLIVQDNPVDVQLAVAMLKRAGYPLVFDTVERSADFRRALEHGPYDLILCDHNLRTWSGLDALAMLRDSRKNIPFVVLAAALGDEAAVEYIMQGAADCVLKDRLERLPVAVQQALRDKVHREEAAHLQELIRAGKREWELTFDSVPNPILLLKVNGEVVRANRAAVKLAGKDFSEVIGHPCWDVLPCDHDVPEKCPHDQALETGLFAHRQGLVSLKGRLLECTGSPVRDPSGNLSGTVIVLHDLTERLHAEQELRDREEQLRQAAKMEAIGRLAGGVAHDFNNLLTIINGYARLVLEQCPAERLQRGHLEQILKAGDRAAALTRQLLAFGRRQVLAPQVLHLNEVVQNTSQMLQRLIGEDIELALSLCPDLGQVRADPGQLEQVLMNLAVNARDAITDGGKVTLETANVELADAEAGSQDAVPPGRYVMLAVSDTGSGMDADTRAHIFEPFFTTKEKGKGTGLGLPTVYGIVKQSDGYISVSSQPGRGTAFKVYLPRVDEKRRSVPSDPGPASAPRGSETVLLAEDEEALRTLVARILQEHGYRVLESANAQEALEIAEHFAEAIDLLLSDVVMPGMDGRGLAERVLAQRPGLRVLLMSGYTEDAIVRRGVLEAGMPFLQKPFTPQALASKVREVLDSRAPQTTAK